MELKEDRNLFSRMLIVAKSRPQFDLENAVSNYELSVIPRSLFAPDGSILHSNDKSKLLRILEGCSSKLPINTLPTSTVQPLTGRYGVTGELQDPESIVSTSVLAKPTTGFRYSVAVVDGMAELHVLDKPPTIKNCSELADHFISRLNQKYGSYDEFHLVFDAYIKDSLKQTTRERRQVHTVPIHYHVEAKAGIQTVTMKKLLSHEKTKDELSTFLSECVLENAAATNRNVVVAWQQFARGTHMDAGFLSSTHEEAVSKIILHAIYAANAGGTELKIYSPDTDVFILAVSKYSMLPKDTFVVTGHASRRRSVSLLRIYKELGRLKAI